MPCFFVCFLNLSAVLLQEPCEIPLRSAMLELGHAGSNLLDVGWHTHNPSERIEHLLHLTARGRWDTFFVKPFACACRRNLSTDSFQHVGEMAACTATGSSPVRMVVMCSLLILCLSHTLLQCNCLLSVLVVSFTLSTLLVHVYAPFKFYNGELECLLYM